MEDTSLSTIDARDTKQIMFDDSDLFHFLLDNSNDYIFYKDRKSRFIKINKRATEVLGAKSVDEIIGKSDADYFPDIADRTRDDEIRIMETGEPQLNEPIEMHFPDGSLHWVSVSKVPFYDENGNVAGIVGISRDITDKKNHEMLMKKSEEKFRTLAYEIPIMMHSIDKQGKIIFTNKMWNKTLGYTEEEVLGKKSTDFLTEDSQKRAQKLLPKYFKEGYIEDVSYQMVKKNGEIIDVLLSATSIKDYEGNFISSLAVVQDIAEKKKLEKRYKSLFETGKSGVVVYEPINNGKDFVFRDFNRAAEKIEGKKRNEVIGKPVTEVFPGVKDFGIFKVFQRVYETGKAEFHPEQMYKDDNDPGSWRENWVYKLPSGEVVAVYDDVTERKEYEERLEEQQANLLSILENTDDIICLRDKHHKLIYFNESFKKITKKLFNIKAKEGVNTLDYLPKEQARHWKKMLSEVLKGKQHQEEFEWDFGNGEKRFYQISFNPIKKNDEIIGYSEFTKDITDEKKAEKALRENENRLKKAEEIGRIGNAYWDVKKNEIYWSEEMYTLYERDPKLGPPSYDEVIALHQPKSASLLEKTVKKSLEKRESYKIDLEVNLPSGKIAYHSVIGKPITDEKGNVISLNSTVQDITERKLADLEVKKSEERLKILFENAPDGIYLIDMKGRFVDGNKTAEEMCGYKKQELIGKNLYESKLLSKKQLPIGLKIIAKNKLGKASGPDELIITSKKGTAVPIEIHTYPVTIENDRFILGIARDITYRKKAEQEIKKSEEKLRNLVESTSEFVWEVNRNGVYSFVSENCSDIIGFSNSEVIGKTPFDFMNKEEANRVGKVFSEIVRKKERIVQLEDTWIHKNGNEIVFETDATPLIDENGELTGYFGICRNITKRKNDEKRIKESEEKYRTLFEHMAQGVFYQHADERLVGVNPAALEMFGLTYDEIIGRTSRGPEWIVINEEGEKIPSDYHPSMKALNTGTPVFDEVVGVFNPRKDDYVWLNVNAIPQFKPGKTKPYQVFVTMHDITSQKITEEKIQSYSSFLDRIMQESPFAMWVADPEGVIIRANKSLCNILHLSDDQIVGKYNVFDDDNLKENGVMPQIEKVFKQFKTARFQILWKSDKAGNVDFTGGKDLWIDAILFPILDSDGKLENVVCQWIDITEQKKAEKKLKESEKRFRTLFNSSTDAYCIQSIPDLRIIDVNEEACRRFGYSREEFKKLSIDNLSVTPEFSMKNEKNKERMQNVFDGEIQNWEWLSKTKSGDHIWHLMTLKAIDIDGEKCLLAQAKDITKIKKYQDELENHKIILQAVNKELTRKVKSRTRQIERLLKQKDDFINQLGHDLKNPLGPFVQLLPILKRHAENEKDKEMIDVLNRNAWYMRNLVKKTIELAKLNSSKTVFSFEESDISEIVKKTITINKTLFDDNQITIKNNISKPFNLEIDQIHIQEVFTNLFNNAVKYTEGPGSIIIDAEKQKNHLLISIKDTGIGIDEEQMQYLFDEYYKVDKSRHDFDSSGLGLPICKRIIEKHNGRIWAKSKGLGKGSTFYFTLPFTHVEK